MTRSRLTIVLSTLAGCALASHGAAGAPDEPLLHAPWRAFDVADFPEFAPVSFDVGDVDGDGDLDVVAAREYFWLPGITVMLNNGDGTYAPEVLYNLSSQMNCGDVELEDIDADGDLDAIATVPGNAGTDSRIAVWRNTGNGTFGPHSTFNAGPGPVGLVVEDFTGDGFPDVVTADNGYVAGTNDTISLMKHNGLTGSQAGFGAPIPFVVGDNCLQLDAADIDADGDLDLAVGRTNYSGGPNGVNVLRNDGTGNFTVIASFPAWPGAYRASASVKLDDMDNDGDMDLVTGGADVNTPNRAHVVIRSNDGAGNFTSLQEFVMTDWSFTPWAIETGDLNGDGWRDVIIATPSGRSHDGWELLMSNGTGGFLPPRYYEASKWPYDLKAFDADGDGDEDVACIANDGSVLTVHLNPGDEPFIVLPRYEVAGLVHTGLDSGDIDHDGDPDIVESSELINVLINNGNATFQPAFQFEPPLCVGDMRLRDMNNDGNDDIIMSAHPNCPPYHFAVALGNGDGTFQPGVVTFVNASQGGQINAFDLDDDGDLDVVLTDPGPGSRIFVGENLGDGVSYVVTVPIDIGGFGVEGADFDHDGNMDIASATALGLTVFPGNGDLTFATELPTGEVAWKFRVADMDGDGNDDFAMIRPQDAFGTVFVAVAYGYGDGGFAFGVETPGPNGREGAYRITFDIDAADVNADGIGDIILSNNAPNDVSVFLGQASGGVAAQDRYGVGTGCAFSTVNDFNLDGILDIASLISLDPLGFTDVVVVLKGTQVSADPVPATLTDFQVTFGTHLSGGLAELASSDNAYLRARSAFGLTAFEPNLMELVVGAVTEIDDASLLDLSIESRINNPGGTVRVRLKNWSTNLFEQIATYPIGTTEETVMILDVLAEERVRAADGRIELSIRQSVIATFSLAGFDSFIDRVQVLVQ